MINKGWGLKGEDRNPDLHHLCNSVSVCCEFSSAPFSCKTGVLQRLDIWTGNFVKIMVLYLCVYLCSSAYSFCGGLGRNVPRVGHLPRLCKHMGPCCSSAGPKQGITVLSLGSFVSLSLLSEQCFSA